MCGVLWTKLANWTESDSNKIHFDSKQVQTKKKTHFANNLLDDLISFGVWVCVCVCESGKTEWSETSAFNEANNEIPNNQQRKISSMMCTECSVRHYWFLHFLLCHTWARWVLIGFDNNNNDKNTKIVYFGWSTIGSALEGCRTAK